MTLNQSCRTRGRWVAVVAALGTLLLTSGMLFAGTEPDSDTPRKPLVATKNNTIRGCTAKVSAVRGFGDFVVTYEKVLVVGIKPTIDPDTDEAKPEYWVIYPDRDQTDNLDENGNIKAVNIPQEDFVKDGTFVKRSMKICRCPQFFWGAPSGPDADITQR